MTKVVKITESQLQKLTETRINEVSAIELANILKDIPCTGESIKSLVSRKIMEYGFEDVNIKFLGYGDNKDRLDYIVHTEGPIFVITTKSNSDGELPCMEVVDVIAYTKA